MAKLSLSLLPLLLLVASAAAVDILNRSGGGCRQESSPQRLSSCRQYLIDGSRIESTPSRDGGRLGWREAFPQCCEELENVTRRCRCEAVKEVVREEREAGTLQGREMREMMQTAEALPALCRISSKYCDNVEESLMFN